MYDIFYWPLDSPFSPDHIFPPAASFLQPPSRVACCSLGSGKSSRLGMGTGELDGMAVWGGEALPRGRLLRIQGAFQAVGSGPVTG